MYTEPDQHKGNIGNILDLTHAHPAYPGKENNLTKKEYTPEEVIRAITHWQPAHKYGLYSKAGQLLGIEAQRVRTLTTQGRRGVIPIVLLRLLMAAHQEGILSNLIERMHKIEIETEGKP